MVYAAGAIVVVLALVAGALAAAGGGCACQVNGIAFTTTGDLVAASGDPLEEGPVDTHTRIDLSSLRDDERLIDEYTRRTLAVADQTIDRGGALTVSAFARSSARALTIYEATVPPVSELRLAKRGAMEETLRTELSEGLAKALADGVPNDGRNGSDVASAAAALGAVKRSQDAPLAGQLLTDGNIHVRGESLVEKLRHDERGAVGWARKFLGPVGRRPEAVAIAGLGATGGHVGQEDVVLTSRIVETYETLCPRLTTGRCMVTASL